MHSLVPGLDLALPIGRAHRGAVLREQLVTVALADEFFQFARYQKDDGKTYLEGEDYNFCRKARTLGFKTWIDPSIKLGHHVGQFRFGASIGDLPIL